MTPYLPRTALLPCLLALATHAFAQEVVPLSAFEEPAVEEAAPAPEPVPEAEPPAADPDLAAEVREASVLLAGREFVPAAEAFVAVLEEDPGYTVAREGLEHALAGLALEGSRAEREGRGAEAVPGLRRALELNPGGSERLDELRERTETLLARLAPDEEPEEADAPEDDDAAPVATATAVAVPVAAGAGSAAAAAASARSSESEVVYFGTPPEAAPAEAMTSAATAPAPTQWTLAPYPQEEFDALLAEGTRLLGAGDYVAAIDHLNVARRLRPGNGAAEAGYGIAIGAARDRVEALVAKGERDAARELFDDLRVVAPGDPTLRNLGNRLFPSSGE